MGSRVPQLLDEIFHGLVFCQIFFEQRRPLVRLLVHRWVEDVFFQLRKGCKLSAWL